MRRLVSLLTPTLLLILPGGVSAATKSQSVTLSMATQTVTLTPKCDRGQRATGGGFTAPMGTPFAVFSESRKIGQRTWQVTVRRNVISPIQVPVSAYVYCDKDAPRTTAKSTTVPVPNSGTFTVADASCGKTGRAQAGGYLTPVPSGAASATVIESFRFAKKTWRSRARLVVGTPTATTYVYCADAGSPKARSGSTSQSSPAPVLSAPCKRGTRVAAGGFSQPNAVLGFGHFNSVFESARAGKSWRVTADHTGATTTLTSLAYCA